MPLEPSPTMTLAEDAAGTLTAAVDVSVGGQNGIVVAPVSAAQAPTGQPIAASGLFAYQRRPAVANVYALPKPPASGVLGGSPAMIVPAGGAAAAYTPIPYDATAFEDDGIPSRETGEVTDATAGRFAPIAIAGIYYIGCNFHAGDPTGVVPNAPGFWVDLVIRAQAINTASPTTLRKIASSMRIGAIGFNGNPIAPLAASGFPFLAYGQHLIGALWTLNAGAIVEFGVRQVQAVPAYGGAPGATTAKPWIYDAFMYLAQSF